MDFFDGQDQARRNTGLLVAMFVLAVLVLLVMTNVLVMIALGAFNLNAQPGAVQQNLFDMLVLDWNLVAAISAGVYQDEAVLELNYPEDRDASVDFNVVMTEDLDFVELQGSGEEAVFTSEQMAEMLTLSKKGITEIVSLQRKAIVDADAISGLELSSLADVFKQS